MDALKPNIVIPMHYKTSKCGFPIAEVDDFLALMQNVKRFDRSEIEITSDKMPEIVPETWVMEHAC